ncbi:MAG: hypothetical protein H7A33_02560 [Deltaproteobacteria bacterium]|nr:hypothetical protein [Deltaproteobacteria bacterium]
MTLAIIFWLAFLSTILVMSLCGSIVSHTVSHHGSKKAQPKKIRMPHKPLLH